MSVKSIIPKRILEKYIEDTKVFNMLVVTSFIRNNNITRYNELVASYIIKDESDYGLDLFSFDGVKTLEDVINLFELAIPRKNAIVNGAVYTPKYIRESIIQEVFRRYEGNINQARIADISCGCGAFLISIAQRLVERCGLTYREAYGNITGIDIDSASILRAKLLISLQMALNTEVIEVEDLNLFSSNTLDYDFGNRMFDIIVGNPPYVRSKNIDEESKALMERWEVCKSGNSDLYIPFFQIGMSLLSDQGVLGFITVNSFLKSVNARSLREMFSKGEYHITIANFGEELIFKGKLAYTCLFFAERRRTKTLAYAKVSSDDIKTNADIPFNNISYSDLDPHKGWNLSNDTIMDAVNRIESAGTPLGKAYNIKNGIATLANDIFIFQPHSEDETYYYIAFDGEIQKIEKSICRDIIKPNILKNEGELQEKTEKVIFPYDDKGILITEEDFLTHYPFAYNYLNLHREILLSRDKGKCEYPWFAFGRTQAINNKGLKLLFPYMTDVPHFVYTSNTDMLIYCGYAIYGDTERELLILKRILESQIFNFYMRHTAKPYSTGYYSYAKNYVKGFGIINLTEDEKTAVLNAPSLKSLDKFLCQKYGLKESVIMN